MNKIHGLSGSRIYRIYTGIKSRCYNQSGNKVNFNRYGARGITCKWKNFNEFYNDMGSGYREHINEFGEKNTSIDRIDNNGNYCKENCRWATRKEQSNNVSYNHRITHDGETLTVSEWANKIGIKRGTLFMRLRDGFSVDRALTQKIQDKKKRTDDEKRRVHNLYKKRYRQKRSGKELSPII